MCGWLKLAVIVVFKAEKLREAQEVCVSVLRKCVCVSFSVLWGPACVSTCFYRLVLPHFLFHHERTKHLQIEAIHRLQPIILICWLYLPASWLGTREQANTRVNSSVPPPACTCLSDILNTHCCCSQP